MITDTFKSMDLMSMRIGKGFSDRINEKANVRLELFDQYGNLKETQTTHNLVTALGDQCAADQLLASPSVVKPGWMELGTGSGQTSASLILAAYISGSRTALSGKTRGANAIITMTCTFAAGVGTGAVTEAGVFNVVTQNTTDMLLYASFSVVNKLAADSLTITWTWTFA